MEITIEVTPSHSTVEETITYRAIAWVDDAYTTMLHSQPSSYCQEWAAEEASKELAQFLRHQYPNATFKTCLTKRVGLVQSASIF